MKNLLVMANGRRQDRLTQASHGPKIRLIIACAVGMSLLTGCAATEYLGLDDYLPKKTEKYDKPVSNQADRTEPFVQRLRTAIPDDAWSREAASEYEPWNLPAPAAIKR